MSAQVTNTKQPAKKLEETRLMLNVAVIMLVTIGAILVLFSGVYVQDIETLKSAPETVWNFICGIPVEGDYVLPLLLTLSILAFVASAGLLVIRWWLGRQQAST